jgi:hypothetical protein
MLMRLSAPLPLRALHRLQDFDCGNAALTLWLQRHAVQAQGSGSALSAARLGFQPVAGGDHPHRCHRRTAGIRALLTHPIDARVDAFYRRFGFEPTPMQDRQMRLLIKDARRFIAVSGWQASKPARQSYCACIPAPRTTGPQRVISLRIS